MKAKLILTLSFIFLLPINYLISQTKQKEIIKEADLLLDMMEYKAAINNYLKALSINSQQREIRKNAGYAYLRLDKIDEAIRFLKKELKLFPDNGDAYDLLVFVLFKSNRIQEAYDFFKSHTLRPNVEENNLNSGLGDFILGMHMKEKGDLNNARIFFRRALERKYIPIKCYVQLADIELIQNNTTAFFNVIAEAKKVNEELYERHGTRYEIFESYFMYGLLYYKRFKIEFERSPYYQFLFLRIAYTSLRKALELNPDSKDTLFNIGCIHYNLDQFKEASEYFKRVLKIEPENAEVEFYMECCKKRLKKSIKGEAISDECPELLYLTKDFVDNPPMEYEYQFKNDILFVLQNISHLALQLIQKGRIQQSIKRYQNGLKIYPESPELNFNLGTVYMWQRDFKKAEKHALIALRRKDYFVTMPDFLIPGKLSYLEREEFLEKAKGSVHRSPNISLSQWTFEKALEEGNYFSEAYDLLGNIYFKKGDFDKSILAFKKVIDLTHEDAMAHYNLGCAYRALDDWKNAEKEWKKAIRYEKAGKEKEERAEVSKDQLSVSLLVLKRPVSFRAHKGLGWLYLKKNLSDKALKEFRKAIELELNDPEPYYELGKIYQEKSVRDERYVKEAIFYFEKYLYLGGEKEKEVREILKFLR